MDFPNGVTVILHTRLVDGADEYNNTTRVDADVPFERCATWAGPSVESPQGATTVITDRTVVLPHGTAVAPTDQITVLGERYRVEGKPKDDVSPFSGWAPGVVVELVRVTG